MTTEPQAPVPMPPKGLCVYPVEGGKFSGRIVWSPQGPYFEEQGIVDGHDSGFMRLHPFAASSILFRLWLDLAEKTTMRSKALNDRYEKFQRGRVYRALEKLQGMHDEYIENARICLEMGEG